MSNTEKINEWAERLSFDELNEEQRLVVLQEMKTDEYEEIHNTIARFGDLFERENLEPNKESFTALSNKIEESKNHTLLAGLFALRIPAYQAVAACLLMMLGTYLVFNRTEEKTVVVEKEVPVYELVRDTVFKEVPVVEYITKTVIRNVPTSLDAETINTNYTPQEDYALRQSIVVPSMDDISKSFGNTAVDVASLEKFKVRM